MLKNKEKVKQLKDDSDINDGGISVLLENVSARIWELCDGSNTLKDIVNYTSKIVFMSAITALKRVFTKDEIKELPVDIITVYFVLWKKDIK